MSSYPVSSDNISWGVGIPMRDGVNLSCDIFFPEQPGRFPTLLLRTPYGKGTDEIYKVASYFSKKGFVFVACDVRGRGDSGGSFTPYLNEAGDGYDAIEWCAKQKWSNGKVITRGASYSARIQWLTALTKPPHLAAMISTVSPSDPFVEDPTCMPSPLVISWLFLISGRMLQNIKNVNWEKIYWHLPLKDISRLTGREIPFWDEYFKYRPDDKFWDRLRYQGRFNEIDVPVLHVSGWYDDEQIGTPLNFAGMRKNAPSEKTRRSQSLLMGPWPHQVNSAQKLGDIDFGPDSVIDLPGYEVEWLNRVLSGAMPDKGMDDPVRIFVMGSNVWKTFSEWPPKTVSFSSLYLSCTGSANSRFGSGVLMPAVPEYSSRFDSYVYDPANPALFIADENFAQIGGPDDYSPVERRDDILVYSTGKLSSDIEVIGPVRADLYVSSSAVDTDFTVKLLDVWPNGYAQRLCDGIVRMRYRDGYVDEKYIDPGKIYRVTVDLWNTSNLFRANHSIRIEVSSSAFPKYARNLNVRGNQGEMESWETAVQKVFHGSNNPSRIILPATGSVDDKFQP